MTLNKTVGSIIILFLASLYWTARFLHSLSLGDEALGVLIVTMIAFALLVDKDRKSAKGSMVRCVRLLVWAVCLLAIGWLEPLLMRLFPAEGGSIAPGLLVGIGSGALVLIEEISFKEKTAKKKAA